MQKENNNVEAAEVFVEKVSSVIVPVVKDMEERIAQVNSSVSQLAVLINSTNTVQEECKNLLENLKQATPAGSPSDTRSFEIIAAGWYQKIFNVLETFPKKHSFRVLFFPEHPSNDYLKKIWTYRFLYLFLIASLFVVYSLGNNWIDKHYRESHYKDAWQILYEVQNKKGKKMMDEAYHEAGKQKK